jgi:hypothetical protein
MGRPRRVAGKTIPKVEGVKTFQAEVRAPAEPHDRMMYRR